MTTKIVVPAYLAPVLNCVDIDTEASFASSSETFVDLKEQDKSRS